MARPLRIEFDGALYRVTSRGNERKAIFRDELERKLFLDIPVKSPRANATGAANPGFAVQKRPRGKIKQTPGDRRSRGAARQ